MVDFFDEAEIRSVYFAEMEALIKARDRRQPRRRVRLHAANVGRADRETQKIREAVQRVHNDYTEWSGPQRLREILPDEADELLKRRFAIVQVWRPIRHPVESFPLAICDANTVNFSDFVMSERRYPNRVGQTYRSTTIRTTSGTGSRACAATKHLCSRSIDSLKDGRARWTAHTAFDDPTAPPNARPRESIEIRTMAFF